MNSFVTWFFIAWGILLIWTNLRQPRKGWQIWVGILFLLFALGMNITTHHKQANPLPAGVSSGKAVVQLALKQSKLSYEPKIAAQFGNTDLNDTDQVKVKVNPRTKRYVFNYKFNQKKIPVYAVYSKIPAGGANAYLIPVKKSSKIASIMTDSKTASRQIKTKSTKNYSYEDLTTWMPTKAFTGTDYPHQKDSGDYSIVYK